MSSFEPNDADTKLADTDAARMIANALRAKFGAHAHSMAIKQLDLSTDGARVAWADVVAELAG